MNKIYEMAVNDFEMIGKVFVSSLYIVLVIVGFGLMILFLLGLIVTLYDCIKDLVKKYDNWRKSFDKKEICNETRK